MSTEFDVILAVSGAGMVAQNYRQSVTEAWAKPTQPRSHLMIERSRVAREYSRAVQVVNDFMDENPGVVIANLGTSLDWALDTIHAADSHNREMEVIWA